MDSRASNDFIGVEAGAAGTDFFGTTRGSGDGLSAPLTAPNAPAILASRVLASGDFCEADEDGEKIDSDGPLTPDAGCVADPGKNRDADVDAANVPAAAPITAPDNDNDDDDDDDDEDDVAVEKMDGAWDGGEDSDAVGMLAAASTLLCCFFQDPAEAVGDLPSSESRE